MTSARTPSRGARRREPIFLSRGLVRPVLTLAYDAWAFFTFLLFVVLVYAVGAPLLFVDRLFGTALLGRFIRQCERVGGA